MSATLTWKLSALGTKTGTTGTSFLSDLNDLVASVSGDSSYLWQVASYSAAGNPVYLVLKKKDASAGRILLCFFTSAPANINPTVAEITAGSVSTTVIHVAYFPSGNADTPSNITATSGTILGDDTNAVKFTASPILSQLYAASVRPYYAESQEGLIFITQNPSAAAAYLFGAGNLTVDASDVAYATTMSFATVNPFNSPTANILNWVATTPGLSGGTQQCVRTNYGTNSKVFFLGLMPCNTIFNTLIGSTDVLTDTAQQKAWFFPIFLASQTKGGGFPLKLRQLGWGPVTTVANAIYNTTGPALAASQLCQFSTGGEYPWLTNFKI